jgi:hypothetical protein
MLLAPRDPVSYADANRKLNAPGFEEVRQSAIHVKFVRVTESETQTAILPAIRKPPSELLDAFSTRAVDRQTTGRPHKP